MKAKNIAIGIIVGISILLIPVLLNIFLQVQLPNSLNVIYDSNSGPGLWLMFWGSYLAAIGSFSMAMVSYLQNKKLQEENDERIHFEIRYRQYEQLERFVKYSCALHSAYYFNSIVDLSSRECTIKAIEKCEKYIFDLEFVSTSICYYKNLFQEPEMQKFGNELANYNNLFIQDAHNLLTQLEDVQKQPIDLQSLKKDAITITQLQENGHRLLNAEMDRISQYKYISYH